MGKAGRNIRISFYKSRGPGGQRKNKRETAVKAVHLPTGIVARATESRSQAQNRELALERLAVKLKNLRRRRRPRLPTRKPAGVRDREREESKKHSEKKRLRGKVPGDAGY